MGNEGSGGVHSFSDDDGALINSDDRKKGVT